MPVSKKKLSNKSADDIRSDVYSFLESFDPAIKTKFENTVIKTRKGNVPDNLFTQRCARFKRVLIPWKYVWENHLTYKMLKTMSAGVVVEFVNDDWFNKKYKDDKVYKKLKGQLGSDDTVSSIISFRSEAGEISSAGPKSWFEKFISGTKVTYQGNCFVVDKSNYLDYVIEQLESGYEGNEKWRGFLYYSIRGGSKETLNSTDKNLFLFNPAIEYASKEVFNDIAIELAYYAFFCIDVSSLSEERSKEYDTLLDLMKEYLKRREYHIENEVDGNLYDFCLAHPSMTIEVGKLYDPIQVKKIDILDFAISDKSNARNIDLTHNEAVLYHKFYWDKEKKCILSPARPTNLFWGFHESNMMQQNHELQEYIDLEIERVEKRLHVNLRR